MATRSRSDLYNAYSSLAFTLIRDLEGKTGGMDCLSQERLNMMNAVYTNQEVDLCGYILSHWMKIANKFKMQRQAGLFAPDRFVGLGLNICYMEYDGKDLISSSSLALLKIISPRRVGH